MEARVRGSLSNIFTVFIPDNSSTTGAGLTGLSSSSTNLQVSVRRELSSTVTVYKQSASNIESITTLGTFAAPTASKCRFKEIDNASLKGWYEIQLADSILGTSDTSRYLDIAVVEESTTALKIGPCFKKVVLTAFDAQDGVRGALTALPNAAAEASGGLYTRGAGAGQINQPANGMVDINAVRVDGVALDTHDAGSFPADVRTWNGTAPNNLVSGRVDASVGAVAAAAINNAAFATDTGLASVRSNTAQSVAAGSITLDASASAVDDYYKNDWVLVTSATLGTGQWRQITGYTGSTKVATIAPNWTTTPTGTILFVVIGQARTNLGTIEDTALSTHASGMLPADVRDWLGTAPNALQSGRVDSYLGAVASGVIAAASFATGALDAVWSTAARTLTAFGFSVTVGTNNDKTGYALTAAYDPAKTAAQAGDAMALTSGERTTLTAAIWAALTSGLTTVGSIGKLLVTDIDAAISSRSTYAGGDTAGTTTLLSRIASALTITGGKVDVNDKTGFSLTSAYDPAKTASQAGDAMALTSGERTTLTAAIWAALTSGLSTVGSIGKLLVDNINATISSRLASASYTAPDNSGIASAATRADDAADLLEAMTEDVSGTRFTEHALEQAPTGGGGGGGTDWTATERQQIRFRLGLDGSAAEPTATPDLALEATSQEILAKPSGGGGGGIVYASGGGVARISESDREELVQMTADAVWSASDRGLNMPVEIAGKKSRLDDLNDLSAGQVREAARGATREAQQAITETIEAAVLPLETRDGADARTGKLGGAMFSRLDEVTAEVRQVGDTAASTLEEAKATHAEASSARHSSAITAAHTCPAPITQEQIAEAARDGIASSYDSNRERMEGAIAARTAIVASEIMHTVTVRTSEQHQKNAHATAALEAQVESLRKLPEAVERLDGRTKKIAEGLMLLVQASPGDRA